MLNTLRLIKQCLSRLVIISSLEIITKYGKKISDLMNIEFDSEPVYGDYDKYIKTKIKVYEDRVSTNLKVKRCLKKIYHISAYD